MKPSKPRVRMRGDGSPIFAIHSATASSFAASAPSERAIARFARASVEAGSCGGTTLRGSGDGLVRQRLGQRRKARQQIVGRARIGIFDLGKHALDHATAVSFAI